MRKSILYFLTALTLLAGCKKEEEEAIKEDVTPSFEEQVKSIYSYPISVKAEEVDCLLWFNYKVNGEKYCFAIERATNYNGPAADFILSNVNFPMNIVQESKDGWFVIVRSKTGTKGEEIYKGVIDVMNEEQSYFNYIRSVFKD